MYIPYEIISIIHDYLIVSKQYHKENFDIVLLDIQMMGGRCLCILYPPTISYMCWGRGRLTI